MINQQRGITLVELLVALTLLTIISLLTWNVLFQGLNFSRNISSMTLMQQEANLLVTSITRIHQTTSGHYSVILENNTNSNYLIIEGSQIATFDQPDFFYSLEVYNELGNKIEGEVTTDTRYMVEPNKNDFQFKIRISNRENQEWFYEIKTIVSKLR